MTVAEALRAAAEFLERKGVDSPRLDAELLLGRALGLSRLELYTQHDRPLSDDEQASARGLLERRGRREPLAYVLGEWGFRRLTLSTDARALVPRPETETVVERALALLEGVDEPRVVDVGTGSGAIALAIAQECPGARVTATDVSPGAVALARENAERLALAVELVETSLLEGLDGPFELVVSNPPYVAAAEIELLQPEVRDWEPRGALVDEGQTEELMRTARDVLAPGGAIVFEAHEGRASSRRGAAELAGLCGHYDHYGPRGPRASGGGALAGDPVEQAIGALRAGKPVLLPTDTVYGLCAAADDEAAVRRLYELKGRAELQPTALLASSVDRLLTLVPELRGRAEVVARTLLPGPYTLVLPNPARRFAWLSGTNAETIGVRVAELPASAAARA